MAMNIPRKAVEFVNHTKSSIPSLLSKHSKLSPSFIRHVQAASHVFPFRANNYVVENLIDWNNVPNDPIFRLTFPQPEMLYEHDMERVLNLLNDEDVNREELRRVAIEIRKSMNPHPAKQKEMNVPSIVDAKSGRKVRVPGVQHKYRETMLFFPSEAQWCHAYCTYCFRWAQFTEVGSEQQFKSKDTDLLVQYIAENPQLTDILFTGGDPGVMKTRIWQKYLSPLIADENKHLTEHLQNIRIGTKSLTYWPYRYTHNDDADDFLRLLEQCTLAGKHVTIQAHFTHPQELSTKQCEDAVRRLRMAGANIRSQAPIVKGINDDSNVWADMWNKQVSMGIIPYYMFVERDTGPKHYFELPLLKAFEVFRDAVSKVSGIARTVRGPSMSCEPGKVALMGVYNDMFILQFLQSRNPQWMKNPFFAKADPNATWLDQLKPYDGSSEFFYEKELNNMANVGLSSGQMNDDVIEKYVAVAAAASPKSKLVLRDAANNKNGVNGAHGSIKNGVNGVNKVNGVGVNGGSNGVDGTRNQTVIVEPVPAQREQQIQA
eukprot:CAMPEP_0202711310 /NCGR_PEP_ID=MMETSP1385-20130828/23146_1 /ASSEMBLY_ACC=CAM_ASM_000861 /TAXON_ID=933848 /ORGANISM="Elphidium margaritaceum" /LENGTH=544 /DNA_ID=CAMNT_0049371025 /DNA_START=119 /DNA_END=1753 /DNA_ORIENTATION=+